MQLLQIYIHVVDIVDVDVDIHVVDVEDLDVDIHVVDVDVDVDVMWI